MNKEAWVRPETMVQQFAANEYVAACGKTPTGEYFFTCDAPGGSVWADLDRNGQYKTASLFDWSSEELGGYHPCNKKHPTSSTSDFYNGFVDYNGNNRLDAGEEVLVWVEFNSFGRVSNYHASKSLTIGEVEVVRS